MKRLILVLAILAMAVSPAFAVSLVCDPQEGIKVYRIDGKAVINAEADGSVKYDISAISAGTHNKTLEAGNEYILDGVPQGVWQWSDPIPFVVTVPSNPSAPTGTGLIP